MVRRGSPVRVRYICDRGRAAIQPWVSEVIVADILSTRSERGRRSNQRAGGGQRGRAASTVGHRPMEALAAATPGARYLAISVGITHIGPAQDTGRGAPAADPPSTRHRRLGSAARRSQQPKCQTHDRSAAARRHLPGVQPCKREGADQIDVEDAPERLGIRWASRSRRTSGSIRSRPARRTPR